MRLGLTRGTHLVCRLLLGLLIALTLTPVAQASGPRYVTGPPFFTGQQGVPIGWRQANLTYFTDTGSLSSFVNHQQADALVAAAASVWNVPVARITVSQGGTLAEHVSSENAFMGANGMVFPADMTSTNAAAIPIAILYDTDGSLTETLLGAGASSPAECAQDGVTESVDAFDPAGYILHAVIVLNGRCTGSAPQQQLQLQYQLERVFGRVLGLAWSQTNDNVFTGSPQPTYVQAQNWPIMHPIDILCGSYTYQCLPYPFQLRPDDIAAMVAVYPIEQNTTPASGKQSSWNNATGVAGAIFFPSGEGMEGVNVLVKRQVPGGVTDGWFETSAVTGAMFRRATVSPFVVAGTGALSSMGNTDMNWPGYYVVSYVPMQTGLTGENMLVTLEPINPLYMGSHSLGPYAPGDVAFSGTPLELTPIVGAQQGDLAAQYWTVSDADSACGNGSDGSANSPMQTPTTGWWNGLLCGYGHASFLAADVKPVRTFTVEVTALDEHGYATTTKAMPVIAAFAPGDATNAPSLGLAATAFQAWATGTTTLTASTAQLTNVRIGIADQRGDGRPDFAYQARLFYADSVTPARVATAGGTITISGSGFRSGNAVSINGVAVTVVSWTANVIVVTAPAMSVVGASDKVATDIVVWDRTTGATSTMTAALTYDSSASLANAMRLVSVPEAAVYVGDVAPLPFAVQVVAADGRTAVVGDLVVLSAAGGAQLGACGSASCTVRTDANGMASTTVTSTAVGNVTLTATDGNLKQSGSFMALAQAGSIVILIAPVGSVNVGATAQNPLGVQVLMQDGSPMRNAPVTFTVIAGGASFSGCNSLICTTQAGGDGSVGVWVTPTTVGTITLQASVGDVRQTISFTGASNVDVMQITSAPVTPAYVYAASRFTVRLLHPDGSGDAGEPVAFTAPAGVTFQNCGSNACVLPTDGGGTASVIVAGTVAGSYAIQAAYGAVIQTVPLIAQNHTYQINLVSKPADHAVTYASAPVPFAVQVMQDGTTPAVGALVGLTGVLGDVVYDTCGLRDCLLTTDANGIASTTVTPMVSGSIVLNAVYGALALTASFTAQGGSESLHILQQPPPAGLPMGTPQTLAVQLIGVDGATPLPNHILYFSVVSGPFAFTSCTAGSCLALTDSNGNTGIVGTAYSAGPVVVQVADSNGQATQLFTFNAIALPDVLKLISAPASGGFAGQQGAVPFAAQAFFSDGATPVSGRTVTITVTNGQAGLAACNSAASCVLTTDASGMISTLVTPSAVGLITVTETDGGATVSSSFTTIARPDVLSVVSAPANGVWVELSAPNAFSVRLLQGDGVTPDAGKTITVSAIGATFGACGAASCSLVTDASGLASTTVTPTLAGTVTLTASDGGQTTSVTFSAMMRPDVMQIVSSPADGAWVGDVAATPLVVQVLAGNGVLPQAGRSVTISVTYGSASLVACGAASCALTTNATGQVSTAVTPLAAGQVSVTVSEVTGGAAVQSVSFTAKAKPALVSVVTTPGASVLAGAVARSPLAVKVVQADGATPVAGIAITFSAASANGGTVRFGACGAGSCVVPTGADGIASTTLIGGVAGDLTLSATALLPTGAVALTAPFTVQLTVQPNRYALTVQNQTIYIAEGATVPVILRAEASENGIVSPGQGVHWTQAGGFTLAAADTLTDASGLAAVQTNLGPLVGGTQAQATACAWASVCAGVDAVGVAAGTLQAVIVNGGEQTVMGGAPFAPVTVQVMDGAGHAVMGAAVSVYQTVSALDVACPAQGRCPAAPVLGTNAQVVNSASDGTVTFQPLSLSGAATSTEIAVSVGTQGFVTTVLVTQP